MPAMVRYRWSTFAMGLLSLVLVGAIAVIVLRAEQSPPKKDQAGAAAKPKGGQATPAAAPQKAVPADFYGNDAKCVECHETVGIKGTAHGREFKDRSPAANHGCESCHGPAKKHVETEGEPDTIVSLKSLRPDEAAATCTTCHDRTKHALWDGSQHDQRNLGCLNCHSIHSAKGQPQLKEKDEWTLCQGCHRNIVHKQLRFNHMPVREGKLTCSSCHNVHGSSNVKLLKAGTTIDESCVSCHAEKRGPYLWEHAPVAESCTTCHDPHGSNNVRLLVSKPPFLCQRCHVTSRHPPTVYDGFVLKNSSNANKIWGRACLNCHQQIHGSNAPSGKALLR